MSTKRLTHGRTSLLIRLVSVVSLLFALAGAALLLAPTPQPLPPPDVVKAAQRAAPEPMLAFTKYSDLKAERATPFEFRELVVAEVALRTEDTEVEPKPEPEPQQPPPPAFNAEGLSLIGTAPGSARAFAVLNDQQSGLTKTLTRGDKVRDAEVAEIHADRIVLMLGEQRAELSLIAVQGSDNLNRQLAGLPPLPSEQANDSQGQASAAAPAPAPAPAGSAVLTGASSAPTQAAVITTAAVSAPLPSTQTPSSEQGNNEQGNNEQGSNEQGSNKQGSNEQGGNGQGNGTQAAGTDNSGDAQPRRSLGISGHMLGLKQQEELGLQQTGLLVTAVRRDDVPIEVGDVILTIGGQTFQNVGDAQALIQGVEGDSIDLELFSGGASKPVSISLAQG